MEVNFTIGLWAIPLCFTVVYWAGIGVLRYVQKTTYRNSVLGAFDIGLELAAFFLTLITWTIYFVVT